MMDVSMSIQEIRRSVLEDIRAREIYIPETGFLAGPTYPVREMVETGIWRQRITAGIICIFRSTISSCAMRAFPVSRRASVPRDG